METRTSPVKWNGRVCLLVKKATVVPKWSSKSMVKSKKMIGMKNVTNNILKTVWKFEVQSPAQFLVHNRCTFFCMDGTIHRCTSSRSALRQPKFSI